MIGARYSPLINKPNRTMNTDQYKESEVKEPVAAPDIPARGTGERPRIGIGVLPVALIGAAALGWFIYTGISGRVSAEAALTRQTKEAEALTVAVVSPQVSSASQELRLPGNTQAFADAPIYARTSGYLRRWYADIGTRVHAGQLLAEIEAPEVDHQLQQARADLETAQANLNLAKTTADRYQFLLKSQSVSEQETDNMVGSWSAKKAVVDAAASNVKRLEDLQSYQKVYAPFDGVITARNTDIGALIGADSNAPGRELFHVAATHRLRVFISVPEQYGPSARNGAKATLTLTEYPGRTFTGTLVRNASSIDPNSRTLLVEVDVPNTTGELLPGAYAMVHLKLAGQTARALLIPANTVLFRSEGLRVALVRNQKAQLEPVIVGRDFGERLEILAGLNPNDQLIVNPPDSLVSGAPVRITGGAKR
jgi:RND family efflux transporter MFP subunit